MSGPLDGIVAAQRACFSTTVNRGDHPHPVPQFGMTLMPRFGDDVLRYSLCGFDVTGLEAIWSRAIVP